MMTVSMLRFLQGAVEFGRAGNERAEAVFLHLDVARQYLEVRPLPVTIATLRGRHIHRIAAVLAGHMGPNISAQCSSHTPPPSRWILNHPRNVRSRASPKSANAADLSCGAPAHGSQILVKMRHRVTSGVNFTENHRFEIRRFLAIAATPSLQVEVLSPDCRRGEMPANVALGGRVWSGGNPL